MDGISELNTENCVGPTIQQWGELHDKLLYALYCKYYSSSFIYIP
jgi:hypothetical protein